ncbi:hypothetical protein QJS04_geneDACA006380 [Acorus gramineus]|uniref:Uncharacterized protein n=1 Tax=Acorus gramineus TaxID=55184 RepID=A0AAV9B067_ACOGR|nr:hypothetical protein QJS04_geneDACA006380 [Acorus gramineus]
MEGMEIDERKAIPDPTTKNAWDLLSTARQLIHQGKPSLALQAGSLGHPNKEPGLSLG